MRAAALTCTFLSICVVAPAVRADELDTLAKSVDERPEDKAAYDAFAKAALKAKRYDDAIKKLKVGVARIPDYGQGYYWLAVSYRSKKEWADAADYYRRFIALFPTKTDAYFGLGASLEGLGDKKGAISAYDKYVSLEKAVEKQRFVDLARAELAKLDPSRAPAPVVPVAAPVAATPVTPAPGGSPQPAGPPRAEAPALRASAEQLRKDGRLDEAALAFQKAIDADRGNVDLYNDLGNVYFALKKYGDAAQAFRDATNRDPNYALGWYNLAHALRKGDKKSDAVVAYRQYMRLKPDDPDPYYGLGQTLKALGDVPGAIDAFKKYVGMEKRPDEQRWVEKARAELEVLEAMQRSGGSGASPSGKVEDKGSEDQLVRNATERLQRELERDRLQPMQDDGLMNPFDRTRDLRDPFEFDDGDLKNPFDRDRLLPMGPTVSGGDSRARLRLYGAAIEAYRRALSRHVEDVSQRYERGIAYALAEDGRAATRAWNSVALIDERVDAAKKGVERLRHQFASRQ